MLTHAQKEQRKGKLTSSVIAAATKRSKHSSPLAAWCWTLGAPYVEHVSRVTGIASERADPPHPDDNRFTERGDDLEPVILHWGARLLGCEMEPAPFVEAEGWRGDSTDALYSNKVTGEVSLAEAKSVSAYASDDWGKEMTAQIPLDYRVQCHWHLIHHPGIDVCWVPFLGGYNLSYRIYVVERDADFERQLLEEGQEFHRKYVATGTPPPVTDLDTDYLLAKYPEDNGRSCEPTPEMDEAAELVLLWRDRRDLAIKRHAEASNLLRDLLRDYAAVECDRYKVSYRNNKDSTVTDWEALAREKGATEAEIHEHTFTKPGPRVLRVTGRGDLKKKKAKK